MNFDALKYYFRSNRLFLAIKPIIMEELEDIKRIEKFKKGDIIYREGSLPRSVYGIQKGKVKIEQITDEGRLRIVYVYVQDEYFGFRPLLCNEKHPVTATALEDCEIIVYEGQQFIKIAKESTHLSFNLVEILSFEFNVWINLITSLSHKSAKERIALILLILNEKYAVKGKYTDISMPKTDIASYAETTLETVVRVMSFFESQDIIKSNGRKFLIVNKKLLEIIAQGF